MNKVRGEQRKTIGAVEYRFLPTHEALAAIEGRLDAGLLEVAQRFLRAKPRQTDVAVILAECSAAGAAVKPYAALPYQQAWDYCLEKASEANKLAMGLLLDRFGPAEDESAGKVAATEG